jgi:hypothetical protein
MLSDRGHSRLKLLQDRGSARLGQPQRSPPLIGIVSERAEQLASWRRVWNSAEGGQGAERGARMPASSVDGDKVGKA